MACPPLPNTIILMIFLKNSLFFVASPALVNRLWQAGYIILMQLWYNGTMQKKHIAMIAGGIIVLVFVVAISVRTPAQPVQKQTPQQIQEVIHQKEVILTKQLLAMDISDPSHVVNIKFIQAGLERYFNDNRTYPKKLDDMRPQYLRIIPQYATGQDYLYAYYPKDKPTAYHLGVRLGGRNPSDAKTLSEDADFNSLKTGHVKGFDGTDPVYDLVGGKK